MKSDNNFDFGCTLRITSFAASRVSPPSAGLRELDAQLRAHGWAAQGESLIDVADVYEADQAQDLCLPSAWYSRDDLLLDVQPTTPGRGGVGCWEETALRASPLGRYWERGNSIVPPLPGGAQFAVALSIEQEYLVSRS